MDAECASLLPGVCEVLAASASSLPDDTSLEKLLDWFTGLSEAGGSLLDACPCLLDFISSVVNNAAADPGVLSFTLRLTGLMAATEDGFGRLQERSVLSQVFGCQRWQDAGLWEDPCFRIGWIQGLRSMLQHPGALGFFVQSGFIGPLLQLQTDASLFVASAANQTLAHVLLSFQDGERTPSGAEYASVVTAISGHLEVSLVPQKYTELRQSLQVLKLLALVLARAGPPLRDRLLQAVAGALEEKCALEALTALSSSPGAKEAISEVFTVLMQYLDNPDSDATVLHKSYQAFVRWMSVSTDTSFATDQLRRGLEEVVKKRVCDMRWEVRDSTVEFLGDLAGGRVSVASAEEEEEEEKEAAAPGALLGVRCTTLLLKEALQDTESYGSADLDWEVKVHTLELAELLLDEAFSGQCGYGKGDGAASSSSSSSSSERTPESRLAGVVELGVVPALLSGLVDCDRPVGLRACRLLTALRDAVGPPAPGAPDTTCPLPRRGWGEEIRKTLGMKSRDSAAEEGTGGGGGASGGGDAVSVCAALAALGLDERLTVLARSSDHVHNSPLSLLQDILTASAARAHPDTQPGQEVIVDCY
ncbi:BRCA1-associated ATM activator 1 [Liparis tanakae]|uniref:BRCA1-associated ATM activator 1 n=1 Tax=Liparis tanakae TaxID=230148 RepID=A0A4Z2J857_9TELE|nr:BRCA1-associated ATM activator 1 [Liparis tanakae]